MKLNQSTQVAFLPSLPLGAVFLLLLLLLLLIFFLLLWKLNDDHVCFVVYMMVMMIYYKKRWRHLLTVLAETFLLLLGLGWLVLFVFRLALIAVLVDHSRRLAGGVAALL